MVLELDDLVSNPYSYAYQLYEYNKFINSVSFGLYLFIKEDDILAF